MIEVGKPNLIDVDEARDEPLAAADVKFGQLCHRGLPRPALYRDGRTLHRHADATCIVLRQRKFEGQVDGAKRPAARAEEIAIPDSSAADLLIIQNESNDGPSRAELHSVDLFLPGLPEPAEAASSLFNCEHYRT